MMTIKRIGRAFQNANLRHVFAGEQIIFRVE